MLWLSLCARKSAADTLDLAVSVEQVVGVERNDLSFRREEVDATALYAAQVKVVAIHELDNGHAKHVLVAQVLRRSEENTSELQSLMRISYDVFCLKKKKQKLNNARQVH